MRKTEITDFGEFYRETLEFFDFIEANNKELWEDVKWLKDEDPYLVVLYNSCIPITNWKKMKEYELLEAANLSVLEFKKFRKNVNDAIERSLGVPASTD